MSTQTVQGFELSLSARSDGTLEAAYIRLTTRKIARTEEIIDSTLLADYDARGRLIGIEILAPVRLDEVMKLVDRSRRAGLRRFLEQSVPDGLLLVDAPAH